MIEFQWYIYFLSKHCTFALINSPIFCWFFMVGTVWFYSKKEEWSSGLGELHWAPEVEWRSEKKPDDVELKLASLLINQNFWQGKLAAGNSTFPPTTGWEGNGARQINLTGNVTPPAWQVNDIDFSTGLLSLSENSGVLVWRRIVPKRL